MDTIGSLNTYLGTLAAENASGTKLQSQMENTDSASSAKELKEACKQFESYFVEQVYKEMLKTVDLDGDGTYMSQLVDYFKDSTVQKIADTTVDQTGGSLAKQMYEQMRRNYGIKEAYNEVE